MFRRNELRFSFTAFAISLPVTWHFRGAPQVFHSLKRLINKIKEKGMNEGLKERRKKNLSLIFPSAFLLLKFNGKTFLFVSVKQTLSQWMKLKFSGEAKKRKNIPWKKVRKEKVFPMKSVIKNWPESDDLN